MLKIPNTTQLPQWLPAAPQPWASEPHIYLLSPQGATPSPSDCASPAGSWGPASSDGLWLAQPRAQQSLPWGHWSRALAVLQSLTSGGENPLGGGNSWETQSSARPIKALSMPCIGIELSMPLLEKVYMKDAKNCWFFPLGPSTQAMTVLTSMRGMLSPGTLSRSALFQTRPGSDDLAANHQHIWQEASL